MDLSAGAGSRLPRAVTACAAVAVVALFYAAKVGLFKGLHYTFDLFSFVQMSRGWLRGHALLHENGYGNHGQVHNYYTILVFGPLSFAMFDAMFFMIFYLENVHGLDPIAAGVHLLPMTAMLIIGSPLAGALISKLGPRLPLVVGMGMAAIAMAGLSRLDAASSPNDTIAWFVLLGLGLSPVMVGATNVIVGNAPVELAGVAGGLQSTAMQVGGALGTAVLGAVMSAKISAMLPGSWHAAHLPLLSTAQLAGVKSAGGCQFPVTSPYRMPTKL